MIIVHTLEHAKAALQTADQLGKPVALQSAPDAIFYAGSLYLLHLFDEAKRKYPKMETTCIVDCTDAEAEAIAAMQTGHTHIRIVNSARKALDIAAQYGITVHTGRYEALDLLTVKDTKVACKRWLGEGV